jgi:hypothetical protein
LLENALLRHCGKESPPPAADPTFRLVITHRSAATEGVYDGPIADLVGAVHTVETLTHGRSRITLRRAEAGRAPVVKELEVAADAGEWIVFRVERPGGDPLEVARELWHPENRVGLAAPAAGDRHDFVVLPCRVSEFVKSKEQLILEQRGQAEAAHAHPYDGLLEYALAADELLGKIAQRFDVQAQFDLPRILILSTLQRTEGEVSHAIDLRLNRTSFSADDEIQAYMAAQVRSLLESGLEHEFLQRWTGTEGHSAFDTFSRLCDEYPNSLHRRVQAIHDALLALLRHGGAGARAVFRAAGRTGARSRRSGSRTASTRAAAPCARGSPRRWAGARTRRSSAGRSRTPGTRRPRSRRCCSPPTWTRASRPTTRSRSTWRWAASRSSCRRRGSRFSGARATTA